MDRRMKQLKQAGLRMQGRLGTALLSILTSAMLLLPNLALAQGSDSGTNRLDPILRLALNRSVQMQEARARGEEIPLLDRNMGVMAAPAGLEVWVELIVKGSGAEAAVRAAGGTVGSRQGRIITARVPLSSITTLAESPGVEYVEASTENTIAMDAGLDSIGADVLHSGAYNYRGSGVLVAVYDTGLDYSHDDFRNGDGTTRVLSMWDQTNGSGTPPSGYGYGSAWSEAQLNDELDGFPAGLVTQLDINGHGTHVMGIAAGNGRATGNGQPDSVYVGVAPAADLLVIKGGDGSFSSASIIDGIAWTFAKADALAQPCVLNLSLGGHSGPHDGTMLYEEAIDIASGTGKVIVVSAGNEGSDALHDRTPLSAGAPADSFSFTIPSYTPNAGTSNDYFLCNIWYEGATTVSVSLKNPYGVVHGPVATGGTYEAVPTWGTIDIDNASGGVDARNGDYQCIIQVFDQWEGLEPIPGTWTIIYHLDSGASTPADMWFYGNTFGASVDVPTSYRSAAHPGTANDALTVGAWVSKWGWDALDSGSYTYTGTDRTSDYALFTSWGPSRDGRQKPEIVAPGQGIMSAMSFHMTPPIDPWRDPDGVHRISQGTSQAAPVVTGTVALLLEIDETLNVADVKTLLQDNARTDSYTGSVPNETWGYGKLDALAAADDLLSILNPPLIAIYQPTGVQTGDITIPYLVTDPDNSEIGILAEYSTSSGTFWLAASVGGDTSGIAAADYDSSLVWQSGSDLAGQEHSNVWFRITPHDAGGWGTSDTTLIDIDNLAPQWIAAEGTSGDSTLTFWFNELVADSSATDTSNVSLSGGLTAGSITGIDHDVWSTKASISGTRHAPEAGVIDGKLYVAGGNDGNNLNILEVYDPSTDSWTTKASMPTSRWVAQAGVIDGLLYVAGGGDDAGASTALEVYDPSTDSWTTRTPMPFGISVGVAGVIDGKLYVASVEGTLMYDPSTDDWQTKASKLGFRSGRAGGVIDGKLYIVADGDGSVESYLDIYDPSTDSWTTGPSAPTPRQRATAGVIAGKLYVVGGDNDIGAVNTLEVYDPATNEWTTETSIPTDRTFPAAGVIDNELYIIAGGGELIVEVYTALPSRFELTLSSGQKLSSTEPSVTLTATSITDLNGNTAASLDTTFAPADLNRPSIGVYQPTGTQIGDVTLPYVISDPEGGPVGLLAEYSVDAGTTWLAATITGDTSDIEPADFDSSLVWHSVTDLADQEVAGVRFRITPHDQGGSGSASITHIDIDNQYPQWIEAEGTSGDSTLTFWFDELVADSSATEVTNFSLSGGLTVGSIIGSDHDVWTTKASAPTSRLHAAADVIDGKLYVVGGNGALSTLEVYDPSSDSWTTMSSMPAGRALLAAGVIDGKLYAAGGSINWAIPWLEVYDPSTDSWTAKAPMLTARHGAVGGVINGRFYVAGGQDGSDLLEVYDPVTDSWASKTSIPTGRWLAVAGVIEGKLYVAGGGSSDGTDLATLEVYDPLTDSWTTKAPMPTARSDAAAGVIDGKLYVAGGNLSGDQLNTLEVYDPATDSWTVKSYMLGVRPWITAGEIDGKLYIAGIWTGSLEVYTAIPSRFELTLSSGQTLSSAEPPVTLTATNIMDLHSNVATSLDTTFAPSDPNRPGVTLWQPGGIKSGDIIVPYTISDAEGSDIGLLAEYSTDGGSTWLAASVSGDTSGIALADFDSSLVWLSSSNLVDQDLTYGVQFRLTPHDPGGWGTADITLIDIDNLAPQGFSASGTAGNSTITFWFDELADEDTATNTSNFSLTSGLTVGSIVGRGADEWSVLSPMPSRRDHAVAGVMNGKLYVAGGEDSGNNYTSTLYEYDPSTGAWVTKTSMPTARGWAVAGVIDGKLYVAGGANLTGPMSKLEVYDPSTNAWTTKTSMPTSFVHSAAGVIDGKLYVAGNQDGASQPLGDVIVYDPSADSWSTLASMLTARKHAVAGVLDGKLYVTGGMTTGDVYSSALEAYDPSTDSWTTLAPVPTTRNNAAAAVIDGQFYVVGGFNDSGPVAEMEVYDPAANNWTPQTPMPNQDAHSVAAGIDGVFYLAGGQSNDGITFEAYTVLPPRFELALTSGQALPDSSTSVTLTASNISDIYGNTIATALDTTFKPYFYDPTRPEISIYGPSETQGGDITRSRRYVAAGFGQWRYLEHPQR